MRKSPTKKIEQYRMTQGLMSSDSSYGANGAFIVPFKQVNLKIIASDGTTWKEEGMSGTPWEHVSVSIQSRCPTWEEMDFVKNIFWRDEELVLQFHVPKNQHINYHPNCLHLWKPVGVEIPTPPSNAVGPQSSIRI